MPEYDRDDVILWFREDANEIDSVGANCDHERLLLSYLSRPRATEALADVLIEVERAEGLHGLLPMDTFAALSLLTEEVGELAQATNDHRWKQPDAAAIRTEAVQVAAVALRLVASVDHHLLKFSR